MTLFYEYHRHDALQPTSDIAQEKKNREGNGEVTSLPLRSMACTNNSLTYLILAVCSFGPKIKGTK